LTFVVVLVAGELLRRRRGPPTSTVDTPIVKAEEKRGPGRPRGSSKDVIEKQRLAKLSAENGKGQSNNCNDVGR
jgi:hypothetical protein